MRPASKSILSAVERTDAHEDRLTEVLACVAQVNAYLAAELVDMAGVKPPKGERYAIATQRGTPSGRRVDMEIATYDGLERTRLIWVEAKDGAAYQPDQLLAYAREVRDRVFGHPDGMVLTIIPPGMSPQLDPITGPPRWTTKTWFDVALAADRIGGAWGRASGQPRWRQAAMAPQAESQWRYLAELVRLLEQKGYARMEPLTPEDVIAAQRHMGLPKTFHDLVKAAAPEVDGLDFFKSRGIARGYYRWFKPTEGKWFSDHERFGDAYAELAYYHHEDWTPSPLRVPAFCAGITFLKPDKATREALGNKAWQEGLRKKGVTVGKSDKEWHVVRTKYLSELVVAGATFDEQVQALRRWATEAIVDVTDRVSAPDPPA